MAETLKAASQGQLYLAKESTYGTAPTFASADAVRHLSFKSSRNPFNRSNSAEKKQTPGTAVRFDRKETASATLELLLRPSGTLNTLPEASEALEAGFGTVVNTTLSTTVSASPSPTTTVFTVASATGLAKGQGILITVGTKKYARIITDLTGSAVTVAPALPSAPSSGAAVKGGVTYKLATDVLISLAAAHYPSTDTTLSTLVTGWPADRLALSVDANSEMKMTISGPAKTKTTPAASKPAAFTTVGTQNPPCGITGYAMVGANTYKITKHDGEIQNNVSLRMSSLGENQAEGIMPRARRTVTCSLDALRADESIIYDNAEAGTRVGVLVQVGWTEGNIIALYYPQVDFDQPDDDDSGDDVPSWSFKGMACESADGQNDECFLMLL